MQPGMSGFANTLALVTVPLLAITGADSLNEWLRLVGMGDGPVLPLALFRRGGVATMFALFAWRGGKGFAFVASAATGFMAYGTIAQAIPGWALPLDLAAVAGAILWISTRREEGLFEPLAAIFAFASVPLLVISESYPYDEGVRLLGIGGGTDVVQAVLRWGAVTALFASFAWQAKSAPLRLIAHFGAAVMAYGTVAQMIPGWALPLDLACVAIALLLVGGREGDPKIEIMAALSSLVAVPLLMTTGDGPYLEWLRLLGENGAPIMLEPILRWAGVAGLASVFAWRAQLAPVRVVAQLAAAFFGCGLVAQIVPGTLLPIVPAAGLALLSFAVKTHGLNRFIPAAGVLTALVAAWAAGPVAMWSNGALLSLTGQPMMIDGDTAVLLTQIIIPALLLIFALWNARGQLPQGLRIAGAATVSLLGLVGVHSLYRLGFAVGFGDKFVQIGLGERLLWAGLLLAAGWGFGRGAARGGVRFGVSVSLISAAVLHTLYYSLILHNPIWVEQAVGPFPVANLLIPLFALVPLGLWQLGRMLPELQAKAARGLQLGVMALVCLFAFATLRQGFVQSILTVPGLSAGEDIFRSILAIALAVGFLLWGIRSQQRDWRIASLVLMLGAVAKVFLLDAKGLEGLMRIGSFVALGFSLIGIGWLYSRQLGAATPPPESSD